MMKMNQKRTLALLLALLMLSSGMYSCSDASVDETGENTADTSNTVANAADETETETEYSILQTLPQYSFDGVTITALAEPNSWWQCTTLAAEEMNGETLNDAIFDRNAAFIAEYNVDFQVIESTGITNDIRTAVSSGDAVYDFAVPSLDMCAALAGEDQLINLNTIETIDFSNEAWDHNAEKYFSIANKLYYGVSDISLGKNETTWIYFFNKNLITEYGLENPYDLVREGKWTFDKTLEMMAAASGDVNGNGEPDEGDRFGLATHDTNYYGLMIAAGQPFSTKDETEDIPVVNIGTEMYVTVYDRLKEFFTDETQTVMEYEGETFIAGNALLSGQVMGCVRLFREMEDDFGIIPVPKYDEAQEQYYSYMIPYEVHAAIIPVSAADADRSGVAIQALSIYSIHYLTPAYYDTVITGKGLRDMDSWEMLDLILDSAIYDLGRMYDWGGFASGIASSIHNKREISSSYKRKSKAIQSSLEETIENIRNNKN